MCGRYATTVDPALLAVELDAIDETSGPGGAREPAESYNVAPTDPVLAVVSRHSHEHPDDTPTRRIRRMRWGLIPPWTKAAAPSSSGAASGNVSRPAKGAPLFNARADTAATKPAFRTALKTKRALVPMDGWYEWLTEPAAKGKAVKVPYFMTPTDGSRMYAAGLWSVWRDRDADGPPLLSVTILTTDSVGSLQSIHDRMPLILTPDRWQSWLDPDADAPDDLLDPIDEAVAAGIEIRRVSDRVNSVRNDGPELIAPVGAPGSAVGEQITLL
ncbi:putative SOS response-associated peptidase YedK [Rhodococcus sp. PvR044]|uniref:SOS response-associated peptidase n=1 Tax=unclassified Rhodococcus (in: high G+C Gram-positive bacteria) TaxID=192944 RepID=UPI001AE15064|nr:SOS response-associated peptidase [Rhodococcus sp. PvR099]MBP1163068.1 putative SOS response-associated peptidase YedK [Rhodococcus sp. PvR099]